MLTKDKYEISLWRDILVEANGNVLEHYEEEKIAIIGSNTMTSQCRAIDPKLIENINGTNTFTFKMYYTYVDTETGKREANPFLKLLVNERKVKVLWKGKWYDLIIKSIQENSGDKSITYTCKDLFVNELSKTGFDLEFDNELMNNQGTVQELGGRVLEGTDWKLAETQDDIIQYKEEPVYELTTLADFETNEGITVAADAKILVFYSVVQNQSAFFQFIYKEDGQYLTEENSQLLVNGECLSADVNWADGAVQIGSTEIIKLPETLLVSDNYRGKRKVQSQKQIFDSTMDKYVSVYSYEDKIVYGYSQTEFKDATFVNNLIINNKDFSSTSGWIGDNVVYKLYPWFNKDTDLTNYSPTSYLKVSGTVLNQGLYESIIYIPDGFQVGEKYVFRVKGKLDSEGNPVGNNITNQISPLISNYILEEDGKITTTGAEYFSISHEGTNGDWYEYELTCNSAITKQELLVGTKVDGKLIDIGFFLNCSATCWIQEVEFFPLVMGEEKRIEPGNFDTLSLAQTVYYYYEADKALDPDNVKYLWVDTEPWNDPKLKPETNGYTKIRSITAKNSNRFNILQTLAETFECWIKFEIEHEEETGKILYNEDGTPRKWVSFLTEVGQETGIGFVYGIDLKTIQRTINSDQITTKVIVSPNNNEYAKNGMCTIARSDENYSKQNFILNFDYYINQGLLDGGALNKDLYLATPDVIGYYPKLNLWSLTYDALTEKLIQRESELLKYNSLYTVCAESVTAYLEEIKNLEYQMIAYVAGNTMSDVEARLKEYPDDSWASTKYNTWVQNNKLYNYYLAQRDSLENAVAQCRAEIEAIEKEQETLVKNMDDLHLAFYKKYSRFIQEGSWTSEEYIDDNLYYLDALSVAYTSSRPKITYNISVIRLSSIEEFKNKVFRLGDISFIQDTEFFGYVSINGVRTPYKEKVLVSEITSFFDSPEKDTFKIQNYKSQFEDLFQRITATTQSLQYASGEYARAANAFTETGEIKVETLQNSFNVNQQFVISAQNESVITDHTGITVTDTSDPSQKTKITSGGIFISTDGGATWKNAIRGEGLSTQYLTAGAINANNIMILDGAHPTFRWDTKGLNAFWKDDYGINFSKFVRFDYNGLYGINGESDFDPAKEGETGLIGEERIWDEANFALTWKGFSLKNKYENGYVQISSEEDIIVVDESGVRRIKIGALNNDNGQAVYGIALKNANNETTLTTDDNGNLWLENALSIETYGDNQQVAIGKLDTEESKDSVHGGRVIDANGDFVVYEDGFLKASGAEISGTIIAGEGSTFDGVIKAGTIIGGDISAEGAIIGGLTVENLTQTIEDSKGIKINCKKGFNFKTDVNGISSPDKLPLELSTVGVEIEESSVVWKGSTNFATWTNLKQGGTEYELLPGSWDVYYIQVIAKEKEADKEYTTWITITNIKDGVGVSGEGGDLEYYETELSTDEVIKFKNEDGGVTLSPANISLYTYKITNSLKEKVKTFDDWVFSLYIALDSNYDSPVLISENNELYFQREYKNIGDEENKEQVLNEDFLHKRTIPLGDLILSTNCDENLLRFLKEQEGVILIKITPSDGPEMVLPINFRYGLNSEIATFNIHAAGFNAAIENSQLSFSKDGLELKNAIIKAIKTNDQGEKETTFEIDTNGNAYFSGELKAATGTFSGDISAATGTFSGGIAANTGTIGGFIISEGRLYSPVSEGVDLNSSPLILYGEEGRIIAKNIEIGTGATIAEYIELGENAKIWNPSFADGKILEAGSVSLTNDGVLNIGNIIISGKNGGSIKNTSIDRQWEINNDGTAIFNDIYVDNAHLANSILEMGTVQSVGSLMLFKDSWAIDKINEDNNIVVAQRTSLEQGDWIYCGEDVYKILEVDYNENSAETTIVLEGTHSLVSQNIITKFGKTNKDYVFSIFGGTSDNSSNLWPFAKNNSLTISSFNEPQENSTEKLQYTTQLILGDLSSIDGGVGFGLYADNVILNGSLVTNTGDTYAGVNTTTGANALDQYHKEDSSRIVFWAGSDSKEIEDIQAAPFQVTEKGSLYAQKGYFKGSIITDATIEASTLKAARIYGSENKPNEPTLKIYDAYANENSGGIGFYSSVGTSAVTDDIEVLRITGAGMSIYTEEKGITNSLNFIKIKDGEVFYSGSNYTGDFFQAENESGRIIIDSSTITREVGVESGAALQSAIALGEQIDFKIYDNSLMNISKDKAIFKDLYEIDYQGQQIIYKFGDKKNMVYRKMANGYDLLIN